MKRLLLAVLVAILGTAGLQGQAGAATSAPYISNFEIEYHLGRDEAGHSTLAVTERITAEFPINKNKGMVREIPRRYDGHSVDLTFYSLTRNGVTEPIYADRTEGEFRIIETGTDEYINGTQVFEFNYSMRNVTRHFTDTGVDEFYWDTNGTGWRTSIERLSVKLTVDEELQETLSGSMACYQGAFGASDQCTIEQQANGFSASATDLAAGENVTIAIGFASGTFTEYQMSLFERLLALWTVLFLITGALSVPIAIWLSYKAYKWRYRDGEIGTIVPEYLPPKSASVAASAAVASGHVVGLLAAQLTDLAVRHYIQILETRAKKSFFQPAEYDIQVIKDISELRAEEKEILSDIFGHTPEVDERMALKKLQNNTAAFTRFSDNDKKLKDLLRNNYGLDRIDQEKRAWFGRTAKVLLFFSVITLSPALFVVWIVAFTISKTLWVLSDEGLALRRYLKGLEMYIKVAETERLKMLQSPEGAEKVAMKDTTDPAQLVKLYERVLPYAILFNQEKEWSKRLGEYYADSNSSPDWYAGRSAFNAAAFGAAMSSFSSSVSATSASSSTSGGSSGGGFSGGGGGGGGGGFR